MRSDDIQAPSAFQLQVWHKADTKKMLFKGFYKPRTSYMHLMSIVDDCLPLEHKEKGYFTNDAESKVGTYLNFEQR